MGLQFLFCSGCGNVACHLNDSSVPIDAAVLTLQALPNLWRDCVGPRLDLTGANQARSERLGSFSSNWHDIWPGLSAGLLSNSEWRDAMWGLLCSLLGSPNRLLQMSALDAIQFEGRQLQRPQVIATRLAEFVRHVHDDDELKNFALRVASGVYEEPGIKRKTPHEHK